MQNFLPRQLVVNLIQLYQCGLKAAGYQKKKKKGKVTSPSCSNRKYANTGKKTEQHTLLKTFVK